MSTLIVVPIKDAARAKTRLADHLGADARARLVEHLYKRTLDVIGPVAKAAGAELAVITSSDEAAKLAHTRDVRVIAERDDDGLNAAVSAAARVAAREDFERFCVIPADLATPDPKDIEALLTSSAAVTVCPSTDLGTNALLISPPDAISFHYGPRSADLHMREARARGLNATLLPLESLSFDIDTSACLSRAMRAAPELAKVCA